MSSTENEKENDEDNTEQLLDNYNTENVDAHDYKRCKSCYIRM